MSTSQAIVEVTPPVEAVDVVARQEVAALAEAVKALKHVDAEALADVVARLERVEKAIEKSVGFPK